MIPASMSLLSSSKDFHFSLEDFLHKVSLDFPLIMITGNKRPSQETKDFISLISHSPLPLSLFLCSTFP